MINAVGPGAVAKQFNVKERAVYTWGEDPVKGNGRCPEQRVDDWLVQQPQTEKFRQEFLMTFTVPAGFIAVPARTLRRMQLVFNRRFEAIAGGMGI